MDDAVLRHVISRIANAQILSDPYPHFFINEIFPQEFYRELLESLPTLDYYQQLSQTGAVLPGTYPERFVVPLEELGGLPFAHLVYWQSFRTAIFSDLMSSSLLQKFDPYIRARFGEEYNALHFFPVAGLIRDLSGYSIGPHTDHPRHLLTLLFYFPRNEEQSHLGTSIYRPIDPAFKCDGLRHHPFQNFTKVWTAPFLPNSLFGFIKSDVSFHGVEPIGAQKEERTLMSYSLDWTK